MGDKLTIVVMGGTGRQGGGVVQHLSLKPETYTIVVLTRDTHSKEAAAVASKYPHVVLRKGDANDKQSLVSAFKGAHGVFAVTNPFAISSRSWSATTRPTDGSVEGEEKQGRNIVDACAETGVKHLVFTSCASALEKTGVPTFEAKAVIEGYITSSNVPYTILGPTGFYENLESPFAGIKQGVVPGLLKQGVKSQMISVQDIGRFAVIAFEDPDKWLGRRFEIAGDKLDAGDMAATMARIRGGGEQWRVQVPPEFVFKLFIPKAVGKLREFLRDKGTHVDIEACRAVHPGLMTWEQWAVKEGYAKKQLAQPSMCSVQ